ncbi:MAG: hypothetical protein QNJ94_15680 [Alphaproteobacteria bacterium]|nr:hypothetical protein [Alphaproteobacteria bacterium]
MEQQLIDAVQSRQGDYDGLNRLLACYDIWSASPTAGCFPEVQEETAS